MVSSPASQSWYYENSKKASNFDLTWKSNQISRITYKIRQFHHELNRKIFLFDGGRDLIMVVLFIALESWQSEGGKKKLVFGFIPVLKVLIYVTTEIFSSIKNSIGSFLNVAELSVERSDTWYTS